MRISGLSQAPDLSSRFAIAGAEVLGIDGTFRCNTILVEGEGISDVVDQDAPSTDNIPTLDATGYLVIPGLIDGHTHVNLAYLRGQCHGSDDMIATRFFATECNLEPEFSKGLAGAALVEGLKAGTTCFSDHYYFVDGIGEAMNRIGVRGVLAECIADLDGPFCDDNHWAGAKKTIENWPHGARVRPAVGPHSASSVSISLLKELGNFAKSNNLPLHMHLSQNRPEFDAVRKELNMTPVEKVLAAKILGERSVVVHLVTASDDDLSAVRDTGASVAFCPASQVLFEELAPINKFLEKSLPLLVATDCPASNDGCKVLRELRTAGLFAQDRGASVTPKQLIDSVTTAPAKALGLDKEIGSIEKGKAADLVFIKKSMSLMPDHELLTNLIYGDGSDNVESVMVAGRWVLWKRELTLVNEQDIEAEFLSAVSRLEKKIRN